MPEIDSKFSAYKKGEEWIGARAAGSAASAESNASRLPGREDGPADAYRHILFAAELTRLYGARIAGAILWANEGRGNFNPDPSTKMDLYNNDIGIAIGKDARTWEEVVGRAREAMDGSARDGSGANGGAQWLPPDQWKGNAGRTNWPNTEWKGTDPNPSVYPFGGEEHKYGATPSPIGPGFRWPEFDMPGASDLEVMDLLDRSVGELSRKDLRTLMSHAGYWDRNHPGSADIRAAVGAWFKHNYPEPDDTSSGQGSVSVRAHQREGYEVASHTRSPPGR